MCQWAAAKLNSAPLPNPLVLSKSATLIRIAPVSIVPHGRHADQWEVRLHLHARSQ
jgi:hypothetical protein